MAEPIDKKKVAIGVFVAFALYTLWFLNNAERMADTMFSGSVLTGLTLYLFANPAYLIIIAGIMWSHKDKLVKSFLAGVALTLALDIVSIPRLPQVVPLTASGIVDFGQLTSDSILLVNSDFIIAKAFVNAGIPYSTFWTLYYLIIPLGMFLLAMNLLGYAGFLKRLKGGDVK